MTQDGHDQKTAPGDARTACALCATRGWRYNEMLLSLKMEQLTHLSPFAFLLWSPAPGFWEWIPWREEADDRKSWGSSLSQDRPGASRGLGRISHPKFQSVNLGMKAPRCACAITSMHPPQLPFIQGAVRQGWAWSCQSTRKRREFLKSGGDGGGALKGLVSWPAFGTLLGAQNLYFPTSPRAVLRRWDGISLQDAVRLSWDEE